MTYDCAYCGHTSGTHFVECPVCGTRWDLESVRLQERAHGGLVSLAAFADVTIATTPTGTVLDAITADAAGVPHGAIVLLHGDAGVGKTRLAMRAMDGWVEHARGAVAFYTYEMLPLRVRTYATSLGVRHLAHVYPITGPLFQAMPAERPLLVVVDSLQKAAEVNLHRPRALVAAVREWLDEHQGTTALVIGRETKAGEAEGVNEIRHEVDVVLHMTREATTNAVVLKAAGKNRFGPLGEWEVRG